MHDERLEQWFNVLYQQNALILKGIQKMSANTDALTAAVQAVTKLVNDQKATIATLQGQVAAQANDESVVTAETTALNALVTPPAA